MKWIMRIGLGVTLIAFSSGCLHSRVEENWGRSYQAQIDGQTADPEAPTGTEPQENLDPETGRRVAERYYESQERQRIREAPSVTITQ